MHTVQSAPDVFGKIVFSASMAICKISSLDIFSNSLDIAAAAATQQAEDEPKPTPWGISESTIICIPEFRSYFWIIFSAK